MSRALAKSPRLFLAAAADRALVKACHVVIFVPLDPSMPHFVVRSQMAVSGAHTPDIEAGVAETIASGERVRTGGRGNDGELSLSRVGILMRAGIGILLDLGHLKHLFAAGSYVAMNDKIARKFFDRRILVEAIAREEWAVVIWQLPAYLALTAVLNPLTRQERFDRLCLVVAIILLFIENFEATLGVRTMYVGAAWSRLLSFKYLLDCGAAAE
jgi:hypothetical protein